MDITVDKLLRSKIERYIAARDAYLDSSVSDHGHDRLRDEYMDAAQHIAASVGMLYELTHARRCAGSYP